jgi:hypothetical protein
MPIALVLLLLLAAPFNLLGVDATLKDRCERIGISGRAVDAVTGKPIGGARVWCQYQFMTSGLAFRKPGEAVTALDGSFTIPSQFTKSKYLYGVTDDPTNPDAWKPDVPVKIQIEHPGYKRFFYEFPTKRQNAKLPHLRQTYPIFKDGADYKLQPK